MYKQELEQSAIDSEELKQLLTYQNKLMTSSQLMMLDDQATVLQLEEWIQMLDVTGFILPFDYSDWLTRQNAELTQPQQIISMIAQGDIQTVRGLMTAIVRRNRFEAGYLQGLIQNGLLSVFFSRLEQYLDGGN